MNLCPGGVVNAYSKNQGYGSGSAFIYPPVSGFKMQIRVMEGKFFKLKQKIVRKLEITASLFNFLKSKLHLAPLFLSSEQFYVFYNQCWGAGSILTGSGFSVPVPGSGKKKNFVTQV